MRPRRIFFFENWKSIIVWLAMSDFGIKCSLAIIDQASATVEKWNTCRPVPSHTHYSYVSGVYSTYV